MEVDPPLRGLTLVVTRPPRQAAKSAVALRKAGADVIEFPVLDITPIAATISTPDLVDAFAIIFVSTNAVEHGLPVLLSAGGIPQGTHIFAIGRATAAGLIDAGHGNVVSPQQSIDSEGLLALPQLQSVQGRHIILVRGQSDLGGRRTLEQVLTASGARVTVLECYRRAPIVPDAALRGLLAESLSSGRVHCCFALSVETLNSLCNILLSMNISPQSLPALLVPHTRVADAAHALGFREIIEIPLAESALTAELIAMKPRLLQRRAC